MYTLAWSPVIAAYELYQTRDREALRIVPDSLAWFAWLDQVSSFAFLGKNGHFTARKEAKLDDGTQAVEGLIPPDPYIRYIRLATRTVLGAMRNLGCRLASGTLIVHWDDDDWMAPHRLSYQIEMLQSQRADLCGASRQLYYDSIHDKAWLYEYPRGRHGARQLPVGNTLCYRKAVWVSNPFPEVAVGEDTRFIWSCASKNLVLLPDHTFYIGLIHSRNTSHKVLAGPY